MCVKNIHLTKNNQHLIEVESGVFGQVARARRKHRHGVVIRKGTTGVSNNGVTANFMFFDRGTFGVLPLTYFYIPPSARAYLFPNLSVETHYFLQRPH